nr:hypothetical protein [Endozoicomonas sp.]
MTIASGNVHEFPSEAHARYIPAVEEKNNQNISTLNGQAISEIQCPQRKMPPSEKSGPDCNNKPSLRKRRSTNIDQPSTICPGRHSKKPKKSFAESGTAGSHGGTVPADIIEEDPTQVNTANRQNEKTTDIRSSSLPGGASVNCNANHEADQADLNDGATAESDAHTDNAENSMPRGSSRDANEAGCTAGPGRASSANRLVAGFAGMAGSTAVRSIRGAVDLSNPFNVLTTVVQHAPVLVSAVADDDSPAATLAKYSAMAMTGVGIATSLCAAASATSAISAAAILGTCGARLVGQIASHIGVRYLLYPRLPDSVREYAAPWLHAGTEIGIAATSPIHTRTPDGTDHFAWPGGRATCGTDVRAVRAMGYGRVDVPSPEVTDLPPAGSAQVAT